MTMRSARPLIALAVALLPASSLATEVTLPLPDMLGHYHSTTRNTTVTYHGPTVTVDKAFVDVVGRIDGGIISCCVASPSGEHCDYYSSSEMYMGVQLDGAGTSVAISAPFERRFDLDIQTETLKDGDVLPVLITIWPRGLSGCWWEPPPTGELTAASVVLDVSPPLAAVPTTWGRIKAAFAAGR